MYEKNQRWDGFGSVSVGCTISGCSLNTTDTYSLLLVAQYTSDKSWPADFHLWWRRSVTALLRSLTLKPRPKPETPQIPKLQAQIAFHMNELQPRLPWPCVICSRARISAVLHYLKPRNICIKRLRWYTKGLTKTGPSLRQLVVSLQMDHNKTISQGRFRSLRLSLYRCVGGST